MAVGLLLGWVAEFGAALLLDGGPDLKDDAARHCQEHVLEQLKAAATACPS